jgi:hypothetical protein
LAYNIAFDKKLRLWSHAPSGLAISINQYKDGSPKLQIGPRYVIKQDKTTQVFKAGRLTLEETRWFRGFFDEIIEEMEALEREL